MSMQLNKEKFLDVIANAPLVAIDLVIRDSWNRILLGRRINEPAKGKWFVPGGRIYKGETLEVAFERICVTEIGEHHSLSEARFIGTFTHIYNTNVFGAEGIATHYIVLAFEIRVGKEIQMRVNAQHSEFKWSTHEDADSDIHKYVKAYFNHPSQMDNTQYQFLNARRDSFNNLVWQTPVISLTAQAFLFTIILSAGVADLNRIIAGVLAFIAALASLQLLGKHRFMEAEHAKILHAHEDACKSYAANWEPKPSNWTTKLSSYWVWRGVLWAFAITAIISILLILLAPPGLMSK